MSFIWIDKIIYRFLFYIFCYLFDLYVTVSFLYWYCFRSSFLHYFWIFTQKSNLKFSYEIFCVCVLLMCHNQSPRHKNLPLEINVILFHFIFDCLVVNNYMPRHAFVIDAKYFIALNFNYFLKWIRCHWYKNIYWITDTQLIGFILLVD